jgi:hypothetical protein
MKASNVDFPQPEGTHDRRAFARFDVERERRNQLASGKVDANRREMQRGEQRLLH